MKHGDDADVAGGFAVAARLAVDPEGVVHNAVGIYLKHAGRRDPAALRTFLDAYASTLPRSALRLAIEKLEADERNRYLRATSAAGVITVDDASRRADPCGAATSARARGCAKVTR